MGQNDEMELKPCPFCGSSAVLAESKLYFNIYSVYCTKCPAEVTHGDDEHGLSKGDAIKFWNMRQN